LKVGAEVADIPASTRVCVSFIVAMVVYETCA